MTPRVARCLECDYPLYRLAPESRHCPECGRKFNPEHPDTMNLRGKPVPRWRRFVLRPRLLLVNLLALLAGVWTLILYRWPDGVVRDLWWSPARVAIMWAAVLGAWATLMAVMLCAIHLRRRHIPPALYRQRPWRWVVVPLIALCAWMLQREQITLHMLVRASRPAMDRWARQMLEGDPQLTYADRRIGWLGAKGPFTTGRHVGFDLTDGTQAWCLLYAPDAVNSGEFPKRFFRHNARDAGGGWLLLERDPDVRQPYPGERLDLLENLAADVVLARRSINALVASLADGTLDTGAGFRSIPIAAYRPRLSIREWETITSWPNGRARELRPDMRALIRVGREAVPALRRALGSKDPEVRLRACWVLGEIGGPAMDALPELRTALGDADYRVAEAADYAVEEITRGIIAGSRR